VLKLSGLRVEDLSPAQRERVREGFHYQYNRVKSSEQSLAEDAWSCSLGAIDFTYDEQQNLKSAGDKIAQTIVNSVYSQCADGSLERRAIGYNFFNYLDVEMESALDHDLPICYVEAIIVFAKMALNKELGTSSSASTAPLLKARPSGKERRVLQRQKQNKEKKEAKLRKKFNIGNRGADLSRPVVEERQPVSRGVVKEAPIVAVDEPWLFQMAQEYGVDLNGEEVSDEFADAALRESEEMIAFLEAEKDAQKTKEAALRLARREEIKAIKAAAKRSVISKATKVSDPFRKSKRQAAEAKTDEFYKAMRQEKWKKSRELKQSERDKSLKEQRAREERVRIARQTIETQKELAAIRAARKTQEAERVLAYQRQQDEISQMREADKLSRRARNQWHKEAVCRKMDSVTRLLNSSDFDNEILPQRTLSHRRRASPEEQAEHLKSVLGANHKSGHHLLNSMRGDPSRPSRVRVEDLFRADSDSESEGLSQESLGFESDEFLQGFDENIVFHLDCFRNKPRDDYDMGKIIATATCEGGSDLDVDEGLFVRVLEALDKDDQIPLPCSSTVDIDEVEKGFWSVIEWE
jgi:hypothetical protein